MNFGLVVTILSLVYIVLITGIYFSKRRIFLFENKIYESLLISTIIGFIVDIVSFFLDIYFPGLYFLRILMIKLYYSYLITFLFLLLMYLVATSNNDKKIIYKCSWIYVILLLINFFLPVEFQTIGRQVYIVGANIYYIYLLFIIFVVAGGIYLLVKSDKIDRNKSVPVFFYMALSIPILLIQVWYPELLLETCLISFVLVLMYHTIENPDLRMLNELELAKENAERANRAKTEFLSSMSHEIRTPLNAIVGFSNSIMEDETIEEAKVEAKDIIMASNNLLEIVNGILDISKIEAGKMEMAEIEYNLIDTLNDIKKLIIPRIGEKPIELITNFSSDIPAILYGDMGKVREIVSNLMTNAVKYTEKGTINLSVDCINDKDKTKLVFSVEDTGRGIEPDKIDKLFTKFERLEEDKNTILEGTGLGLAITKSLVEMMNGKIVVQSKYGSGSKFTVYLEQRIVKMIDDRVEVNVDKNTDIVDYKNKRILVVDDNKLNIKVATRLLKNYNIVPDTVLSGIECIEKLKTNTYDLILMDDMMPNMSGTETLQELKKDKYFNTKVVVLTANAIQGMKEKYLSSGFTDYLAKPIDREELERILKMYLRG